MRHRPPWLVEDDCDDVDRGVLKTGKEAEVFLVERRSGPNTCLLAHKRYRPHKVGKGDLEARGFRKATTFARATPYLDGRAFGGTGVAGPGAAQGRKAHREARAVARRTSFGREVMQKAWRAQEWDAITRLWEQGADVPFPVEQTADGFLMEFVGDDTRAAPRLSQARLSRDEVVVAWQQLEENLRVLVRADVVHGDLSAYNVLWWKGQLVIIDLPQSVSLLGSPNGFDLLHRDLLNVSRWFGRRGVAADPDELLGRLLDEIGNT